jgi:tRNA(Ile)-lysidine synthase
MQIISKIKHTIDKYNLLKRNDSVLIALSGGPDSVFLLRALNSIKNDYGISISAVHINHNIRKNESVIEENSCRKLCDDLDVELFLVSENIPVLAKKSKTGLEETARNFRLGVYDKLCDEFGFTKIATGHHRDDRVETVLFRILRGTGRSGLTGIPMRRDKIIRPLFDISKEDILKYLKSHKLKYCVDKSNLNSEFSRNYLRNKLLPSIRKNINSGVDNVLINLSETASDEELYLNNLVEKQLKRVIFQTAGGKLKIHRKKILKLDLWLRRRVLRYCMLTLSSNNVAPDREVIERLEDLLKKPNNQISLPGGIQAVSLDDSLVLYKRHRRKLSKELIIGKKIKLEWPSFKVKSSIKNEYKPEFVKKKKAFTGYFDFKKLHPPFEIRLINEGDRFQPLGMKGKKKIGNYLTDAKYPAVYRDEVMVVTDQKGIFWLVGHEIDERAKIDYNSEEVLKIEFHGR